jgi:hypothetical protein
MKLNKNKKFKFNNSKIKLKVLMKTFQNYKMKSMQKIQKILNPTNKIYH